MRVENLVAAVYRKSFVKSTDPNFTAQAVRDELTESLRGIFTRSVVNSRSGYWLRKHTFTTVAGKARYRIPHRAVIGLAESVQLEDSEGLAFDIEGDQIVFVDDEGEELAPNAGLELRIRYYLRPSALYEEQAAGAVTAVNPTLRTVTVNSVPLNRITGIAIATGATVDIVHPNGWHELSLVGVAATLAVNTFTFPVGTDLSDVEVGDFVRAAEQTDWPCITDDYDTTLVYATAISILESRNQSVKAKTYEKKVEFGLAMFTDLLKSRIKNQPRVVKQTNGGLRGRGRGWPFRR